MRKIALILSILALNASMKAMLQTNQSYARTEELNKYLDKLKNKEYDKIEEYYYQTIPKDTIVIEATLDENTTAKTCFKKSNLEELYTSIRILKPEKNFYKYVITTPIIEANLDVMKQANVEFGPLAFTMFTLESIHKEMQSIAKETEIYKRRNAEILKKLRKKQYKEQKKWRKDPKERVSFTKEMLLEEKPEDVDLRGFGLPGFGPAGIKFAPKKQATRKAPPVPPVLPKKTYKKKAITKKKVALKRTRTPKQLLARIIGQRGMKYTVKTENGRKFECFIPKKFQNIKRSDIEKLVIQPFGKGNQAKIVKVIEKQ